MQSSSLAGLRRVHCGLLACGERGLLATSTVTWSPRARGSAGVLFADLARKLESLRPVGLSVELALAGPAPDMSATVVSVSVMLSITLTNGAAAAPIA